MADGKKARKEQLLYIDNYSLKQTEKFKNMLEEYNSLQLKSLKKAISTGALEKMTPKQIEQYKINLANSNLEVLWADYKISGDPVDLVAENLEFRVKRGLKVSDNTAQDATLKIQPKLATSDLREIIGVRNTSYRRLSKAIDDFEVSNNITLDQITLADYSNVFGDRTALQNTQSAETTIAKDIEEDDFWIYDGHPIDKKIRPFCAERVFNKYKTKEIDSWNQLDWAGKSGDVWIFTGGCNCRHTIFAI